MGLRGVSQAPARVHLASTPSVKPKTAAGHLDGIQTPPALGVPELDNGSACKRSLLHPGLADPSASRMQSGRAGPPPHERSADPQATECRAR